MAWGGTEQDSTSRADVTVRHMPGERTPADTPPMLTTFTNRWPWKTQEKLTIALLPVLAAIPAFTALSLNDLSVTPVKVSIFGVGVLFSALLWRPGTAGRSSPRSGPPWRMTTSPSAAAAHGETTGDLSAVTEIRTYRHTITLENVLTVRTLTGELRIPVRLLVATPTWRPSSPTVTGHRDAVVNAVSVGAL
jgi:hypothetical protein